RGLLRTYDGLLGSPFSRHRDFDDQVIRLRTSGMARRSWNFCFGSLADIRQCPSTSGRSNDSWARSPTTRLFESKARATLEKRRQKSTAIICGGSVETGLRSLVDGRSAREPTPRNH